MMRHSNRGLTLVELLVAMTIFTVLGAFLFRISSQSLSIYRKSISSSEYQDRYDQALLSLSSDFRCLYAGDPEGEGIKTRMLCALDREPAPVAVAEGEAAPEAAVVWGTEDPRRLLLRFVRTIPGGENGSTASRFAGTYADQEAYLDGVDDEAESFAERETKLQRKRMAGQKSGPIEKDDNAPDSGLRPTLGLAEVMYFVEQSPADPAGSFTLYRATRSPIGGPDSFFAPRLSERMTEAWVAAHADAVVTGVARLDFAFWSQLTDDWAQERIFDRPVASGTAVRGEPERVWDSTRAGLEGFGLNRGAASANIWEDDVIPESVLISLTLSSESAETIESRLAAPLPGAAGFMTASETRLMEELLESGPTFVRCADEWLQIEEVDGNRCRIRRAARGSGLASHPVGTPLAILREFRKVVEIPAARSWFTGGENR